MVSTQRTADQLQLPVPQLVAQLLNEYPEHRLLVEFGCSADPAVFNEALGFIDNETICLLVDRPTRMNELVRAQVLAHAVFRVNKKQPIIIVAEGMREHIPVPDHSVGLLLFKQLPIGHQQAVNPTEIARVLASDGLVYFYEPEVPVGWPPCCMNYLQYRIWLQVELGQVGLTLVQHSNSMEQGFWLCFSRKR